MTAPYYADDTVTLYHGDSLHVLPELPDASVDSVVTDPPYALSFMSKPWDAYGGHEDAGFAYWLTGLIDGEGCFTIKAHTRGTHAPCFHLTLRSDERGVLERIRRTVGVGSLTDQPNHQPNPVSRWVIQDKAGCQRLVDLLDKYPLRAKKHLDYLTWREAVCEWTSRPRGNRWHGAASNARMAVLRERLMSGRGYVEIPWSGNEYQDWCRLWARECLRVLKPGGHLLAFGGTRTHYRLACAIEDAGFEIRDSIAWLYGSGFPKSLDVSKAIDKSAGVWRGRAGDIASPNQSMTGGNYERTPKGDPVTAAAAAATGLGTALKPAHEPIVVARKPIQGTVADNVQQHGTGALNIDVCRLESESDRPTGLKRDGSRSQRVSDGWDRPWRHDERANRLVADGSPTTSQGRWPPNVVIDDHTATGIDQQSGNSQSSRSAGRNGKDAAAAATFGLNRTDDNERGHDDYGGASSRFFPTFRYCAKAPSHQRPTVDGESHATVKPLDLMRWLIRLVTPPHGVVLDPFAGSGTTAEACIHEYMRCITIEREEAYLPLIVARLSKPMAVGFDFDEELA